LCSGTGTTVSVGSRLTLAGGVLSADAQLTGTSSQLAAGDGSAVTVGSGLTLAGGTLSASGAAGITQLTGSVTAGPGAGSQAAAVTQIDGVTNVNLPSGFESRPVGPKAVFAEVQALILNAANAAITANLSAPGSDPTFRDITGIRIARVAWDSSQVTFGGDGADAPSQNVSLLAAAQFAQMSAGQRLAFQVARLFTGSSSLVLAEVTQGLQTSRLDRYTGGTANVDDISAGHSSYFLECAYTVGSGGQTFNMPATPWSAYDTPKPGRTFVFADVLGNCSVGDPIVLTDPSGRTFGGAAGPLTITKPFASLTAVLDSTLNNWILMFTSGTAI
jgi:hypothetical protein